MPSLFLGVYRAAYAYTPQSDSRDGIGGKDILYILDNSTEDGWWKAKKRILNQDEAEPVGLVPDNISSR